MISRLKRKVTVLTAASLLSLLVLIVSGMNIISFISLKNEADETLSYISDSGGRFPEGDEAVPQDRERGEKPKDMPSRFSPETQFETRYFSVVLTDSGDTVRTDTGRIAAVDTGEAVEYAKKALFGGKERGFSGNYRYLVKAQSNNNYLVIFLDCTRKLESFKTFLYSSIIVSFAGFVAVTVIIIIISGKIISPIAESYEKQKRFITDASHELRTPLAIINANVDVIEDEVRDKESINDIRLQTERLKSLTEDLVVLSRMEEGASAVKKEPFNASDTAADTADGFKVLAERKGVAFTVLTEPDITLNGDKNAFGRLISILLDNAVKYTPAGGKIDFTFSLNGKSAAVICRNTVGSGLSRENVSHIFDRFYRTDESRNSATGGHGIGLSIAKATVEAHSGRISAAVADDNTLIITAAFPI